jgi:hypothetical protein
MARQLPSLAECVRQSGLLFDSEKIPIFSLFGIQLIKLNPESRSMKLMNLLGQPFIGNLVYKSMLIMDEQRVLDPKIVKISVEDMLRKNLTIGGDMIKLRDPDFFCSQDYNSAVTIVTTRIHTFARRYYKIERGY